MLLPPIETTREIGKVAYSTCQRVGGAFDGTLKRMTVKIAPRSYALKALEDAKKDLSRDKYLIPVAFIVIDDEVVDFNLSFDDYEQKRAVYGELVKVAKARNARAIITINDSTITDAERDESRQECIYLTVSGPHFQRRSFAKRFSLGSQP